MVTFINKSSKGKRFSCTPVNVFTLVNCFVALNENLGNLWVNRCIRGKSGDSITNSSEIIEINTSVFNVAILFRVFDLFPFRINPVLGIELDGLRFLVCFIQICLCLIVDLL